MMVAASGNLDFGANLMEIARLCQLPKMGGLS